MELKINLGDVSVEEYNTIMKQLNAGQLGECIDLFMRFRQLGSEFAQKMQEQTVAPPDITTLQPPLP